MPGASDDARGDVQRRFRQRLHRCQDRQSCLLPRSLYHASTELELMDLGNGMIARLHSAVRDMLFAAQDRQFANLDDVVLTWVAAVTSGTRQIFEEDWTIARLPAFRTQLLQMSRAYLEASTVMAVR
ncbi:hypothetical protein [Sinorhizobium meliloti]|uniref:hypothetical protein n=1 Tax=Rhizobium meliloti TaxID=382 RepID=UPI002D77AE7F|nr:hypothetical protein [Sinorhizobium meliloti]